MEFPNPDSCTTRAKCADMFASVAMSLLTYLVKNLPDAACAESVQEIRATFSRVRGTILPNELLIERAGKCILIHAKKISEYDEEFLRAVDLHSLFAIAELSEESKRRAIELRGKFFASTPGRIKTVVLDALNLLLVIYARYAKFGAK